MEKNLDIHNDLKKSLQTTCLFQTQLNKSISLQNILQNRVCNVLNSRTLGVKNQKYLCSTLKVQSYLPEVIY